VGTPEQQIEAPLDGADPGATPPVPPVVLSMLAEMSGVLTAQTEMLGLIAVRLGITSHDVREWMDDHG
jgi:hypothetical protein